jgi:hypothetical protein
MAIPLKILLLIFVLSTLISSLRLSNDAHFLKIDISQYV